MRFSGLFGDERYGETWRRRERCSRWNFLGEAGLVDARNVGLVQVDAGDGELTGGVGAIDQPQGVTRRIRHGVGNHG